MQATSEVLKEGITFLDRKDWPTGPWGAEPDLVAEPPMLMLRQNNGAWAGLIKIAEQDKDKALELERKVQTDGLFHPHRVIVMIMPDQMFFGKDATPVAIKDPGLYMGIFYGNSDDVRPAELKWLDGLPPGMREDYMRQATNYISLSHARYDLDRLLRLLRLRGLAERIDAGT
jgi:hypothetical protein